jgi:hypothetical protein
VAFSVCVVLVVVLHRRSENRLQERRVRALIFATAFVDPVRSETVCRVDRVDVLEALQDPVDVSRIPEVEKGEVLVDSRGSGSFQRRPPHHESMFSYDTPFI